MRRNKCQRVGKVFVRTGAYGKVVSNVTRDFMKNQFLSLSIHTVLPDNIWPWLWQWCVRQRYIHETSHTFGHELSMWSSSRCTVQTEPNAFNYSKGGSELYYNKCDENPVTLESGSPGFVVEDNILRISRTCKIQYTLDRSGDSSVIIIVRRTPSHTTNFFVPFLDNTILVFPYLLWKGVFWYTTMTSTDIENWSIDEFRSSIRPEHSITNIEI